VAEQINVPGLVPQAPDKGETFVSVHDGMVVLHLPKPVEYAVYPPLGAIGDGAKMIVAAAEADKACAQLAINVALQLVDLIYEARGDMKPVGGAAKHELIERHRRTLTRRLEVTLNSLREKKTTSNAKLAQSLMDVVLHEIFT
jgi:hypothetical protein